MFLDEIAGRLVNQGVGVIDTDIFLSSQAAIPDAVTVDKAYLTLIERIGMPSVQTQNDTATERPMCQLYTRALGYPVARAMAQAAYNALGGANGLYNLTLNGTWYVRIKARQPPSDAGQDGTGRVGVSFNVEVEKVPS